MSKEIRELIAAIGRVKDGEHISSKAEWHVGCPDDAHPTKFPLVTVSALRALVSERAALLAAATKMLNWKKNIIAPATHLFESEMGKCPLCRDIAELEQAIAQAEGEGEPSAFDNQPYPINSADFTEGGDE